VSASTSARIFCRFGDSPSDARILLHVRLEHFAKSPAAPCRGYLESVLGVDRSNTDLVGTRGEGNFEDGHPRVLSEP